MQPVWWLVRSYDYRPALLRASDLALGLLHYRRFLCDLLRHRSGADGIDAGLVVGQFSLSLADRVL